MDSFPKGTSEEAAAHCSGREKQAAVPGQGKAVFWGTQLTVLAHVPVTRLQNRANHCLPLR